MGGGGEDRESAGRTEKGKRCGERGERESVVRMKASLLLSPQQVFCLRVSCFPLSRAAVDWLRVRTSLKSYLFPISLIKELMLC